jgi:hypothetical protein
MLAARGERIKAEEAAYAAGYDKESPTYAVDLFGKNEAAGEAESETASSGKSA